MDQSVWLISTPLGNALRQSCEVDETEEGGIRLKESTFLFVPSPIPKTIARVIMVSKNDLPSCPRKKSSVCNVCGYVVGPSVVVNDHPAWRFSRSALGVFREAYTLSGGNMLFLNGKLVFKGAKNAESTSRAIRLLIHEPVEPVLKVYLVVVCAYMLKNLFVHPCCLLEEMLSHFSWCRIVTRTDEMSNAVLFHITDWSYFMPLPCPAPHSGMVSVSRRGVMNVRFGYHDGMTWQNNAGWVQLVDKIRDFVACLC